jgi:DNA-binding transcriptional MerR regulator
MSIPKKVSRKLYYSIGEVAKMYNVNTSLIRFWEKEFDIIKPKKNNKGNRLFTPKDVENFNKIYELVKVKGFTLDGAKKELKVSSSFEDVLSTENRNEEVVLMLKDVKLKIAKMLDDLD